MKSLRDEIRLRRDKRTDLISSEAVRRRFHPSVLGFHRAKHDFIDLRPQFPVNALQSSRFYTITVMKSFLWENYRMKLRRIFAWIIDWNLRGIPALSYASIFKTITEAQGLKSVYALIFVLLFCLILCFPVVKRLVFVKLRIVSRFFVYLCIFSTKCLTRCIFRDIIGLQSEKEVF